MGRDLTIARWPARALHPRLDERQHLRLFLGSTPAWSFLLMRVHATMMISTFVDIARVHSRTWAEGSAGFKNCSRGEDQHGGRQAYVCGEICGRSLTS